MLMGAAEFACLQSREILAEKAYRFPTSSNEMQIVEKEKKFVCVDPIPGTRYPRWYDITRPGAFIRVSLSVSPCGIHFGKVASALVVRH